MKITKNFISHCVNYIPGFFILAFGMYALHISVVTIEQQEAYLKAHHSVGQDIIDLHDSFFKFEIEHHEFESEPSQEKFEKLKEKFEIFNNNYNQTITDLNNDSYLKGDLGKTLVPLRQDILAIAQGLVFKQKTDQVEDEHFEEKIESLLKKILTLQQQFRQESEEILSPDVTRDLSQKLYWSVLAISFCGFLLFILNTHRLSRLKAFSAENEKNITLLRNRQMAIDSSRDGIMMIDRDGNIYYLNKAFLQIHNIPEDQMPRYIGASWQTVFQESEQHKVKFEIIPALEHQGYWRGDFIHEHDNGEKIYTETSITRLSEGGLIGSTLDITEEKRVLAEKSKIEDQFFQAQKMEAIGRLAGGIAHDFNNILAAMNGYAEFLVEDLPPQSQQQQFAENILQAGRQARELVDQMLAFSRRTESAIQTVDIIASVQESASMLRASLPKTIILEKKIEVTDALIKGNATQISQTIMNLCVNAKDAMEDEHGKLMIVVKTILSEDVEIPDCVEKYLPDPRSAPYITIDDLAPDHTRLVLGHLARGQSYVLLRVADTGCGMTRLIMEHIFEPFFTTKPVDKGTGLGLATVHGIITSHQGMLVVDSVIGKGTCFDLYFPYIGEGQVESRAAQEMESKTGIDAAIISSIKILLVEDQDNVKDMMTTMLARMGFKVDTASNGLDALDMIRENPHMYTLVITDHNMPRMTGLELVQQVYIDLPDLPFILFSGYSQKEIEDIQKLHPAIRAVLRKPVAREILERKIQSLLEQRYKKVA